MKIPADWTFKNSEIVAEFDSHVREQLPWYDLATGVVAHVARHYIPQNGMVYDVGASTGNISRIIAPIIESRKATLVAIDNSKEMLEKYSGPVPLIIADAMDFDFKPFDFAVCFLVLLFIPPSKRAALIKKLQSNVLAGGAIMIVDKCVPHSGYVATIMSRMALAGKVATGVCAADIISKELSLSGVQRPIHPSELGNAKEIFRFGDFAAWIME